MEENLKAKNIKEAQELLNNAIETLLKSKKEINLKLSEVDELDFEITEELNNAMFALKSTSNLLNLKK